MRVPDKTLTLAWFTVLLASLTAAAIGAGHGRTALLSCAACALISTGCWLFVTLRLARFHRGLHRFLRHLLASDYETGMREGGTADGELAVLTHMCNRLAEQLRAYDVLRADRVCLTHRAMDVILQSTEKAVFLYDVPQQAMRINGPLQRLLGSDKTRFARDTLRDLEGNAPFFAALDALIAQKASENQVDTRLRLPGSVSATAISVRFFPIKGVRESVNMLVGLVVPAETATPPRPTPEAGGDEQKDSIEGAPKAGYNATSRAGGSGGGEGSATANHD